MSGLISFPGRRMQPFMFLDICALTRRRMAVVRQASLPACNTVTCKRL